MWQTGFGSGSRRSRGLRDATRPSRRPTPRRRPTTSPASPRSSAPPRRPATRSSCRARASSTSGTPRRASQELLNARAYNEADQGFKAALAAAPEGDAGRVLRAQIAIGQIQILVARKEWKAAADALAKFVAENPRSSQFVFATELLAEASVNAAATERDDKARSALYQQATKAVQSLRPYKEGETEKFDLRLRQGAIMDIQAQTEIGFKGEEAAAKYLSKASDHYQTLYMSRRRDIADPGYLVLQEELMYRAPRALARLKKYSTGESVFADVASECNEYLKTFPKGKHAQEVRTLLNEANVVIRTGEASGESFFDTLDTTEQPDNEAIADDYVLTDEEAGVPPEPEADEEEAPADGEAAEEAEEAEGEGEAAEKPAKADDADAEAADDAEDEGRRRRQEAPQKEEEDQEARPQTRRATRKSSIKLYPLNFTL